MEEQRARQEAEARQTTTEPAEAPEPAGELSTAA